MPGKQEMTDGDRDSRRISGEKRAVVGKRGGNAPALAIGCLEIAPGAAGPRVLWPEGTWAKAAIYGMEPGELNASAQRPDFLAPFTRPFAVSDSSRRRF